MARLLFVEPKELGIRKVHVAVLFVTRSTVYTKMKHNREPLQYDSRAAYTTEQNEQAGFLGVTINRRYVSLSQLQIRTADAKNSK